jgi:hypothetical protein
MKKLLLLLSIFLTLNLNAQLSQIGSDLTGTSVAMNSYGTIVALGATNGAGSTRIYQYSGGSWTQLGATIGGEAANDQSGMTVSLNGAGNIVAIGAGWNDGNGLSSGHVRVFEYVTGSWIQIGSDIDGEMSGDLCGRVSLSEDGQILAVGAHLNDGTASNAGHVRVFENVAGSWVQMGMDLDGEAGLDWSGTSIELSNDGSRLAIGATSNNNGSGINAGHVRVYEYSLGTWTLLGADIDGEAANDDSGTVSLSGDGQSVVIGARENDDGGTDAGHARVYEYNGTSWIQKGADIDGLNADDDFGVSTAISFSGDTIAVGARWNDDAGVDAGQVRVFSFDGSAWNLIFSEINGASAGDWFGHTLDMNSYGTAIISAAPLDGTLGTGRVFSLIPFCSNSSSNFNANACISYTVPSGDETYTTMGTYTVMDTIVNSETCDSVMTISLTIGSPSAATDTQTACNSYLWIDGNTYTSSNNTATHTLLNSQGCDSLVTLDLTINTVNIGVTQNESDLMADQNGAVYQWIACPAMTEIPGATSQNYSAVSNGDFAVIVDDGTCIDTSTCFIVEGLGFEKEALSVKLMVYPNPTMEGNFSIDLGNVYPSSTITITDLNGKLIQTQTFTDLQILELNLEEPAGTYILSIQSANKEAIIQLIKE